MAWVAPVGGHRWAWLAEAASPAPAMSCVALRKIQSRTDPKVRSGPGQDEVNVWLLTRANRPPSLAGLPCMGEAGGAGCGITPQVTGNSHILSPQGHVRGPGRGRSEPGRGAHKSPVPSSPTNRGSQAPYGICQLPRATGGTGLPETVEGQTPGPPSPPPCRHRASCLS